MRLNNPIFPKNGQFLSACRHSLILCLVCIHPVMYSQSIGNWTFNNTLTGTPGLHNTVSIADFSGAVPIHSFNGAVEYFGENGWPAGSINTAMYLEFNLTPSPGYQLDISSIVLRLRRSNTGSPVGAGPNSWALRSSLDGFTTDIASGSMTYTYANYTVTPGSAFLQLYSTVTFRLYGYNTSVNPGGSSRLVADNITVTGLGYLLPVKQIVLQALVNNNKIRFDYNVFNTEKNSKYFIEGSADGIHFSSVYSNREIDNAAEKKYSWTENISNGMFLYYRAVRVNSFGEYIYSDIVMAKANANDRALRSFVGNNRLSISGEFGAGVYRIQLYSISGQLIQQFVMTGTFGYNSFAFSVEKKLPAAVVLHITNGRGYTYGELLLTR